MLGVLELDEKWLDMHEVLKQQETQRAKDSGGPKIAQGSDTLTDIINSHGSSTAVSTSKS